MELRAFMGLRDHVSPFPSLLDVEIEYFLRVLDNCGIFGPKNGRRLPVDVDFGILKFIGLRGGLSRVEGFHCSRRMARSVGTETRITNHSSV
jgi:hypothetical protein